MSSPLKSRAFEFDLARRSPLALPARDRGRAVGRTADDLVEGHLSRVAIWQTDDDHAEMQEVGDDREEVVSLPPCWVALEVKAPPTLPCRARPNPKPPGLLPEASHRRGDAAVTRRCADGDCVV